MSLSRMLGRLSLGPAPRVAAAAVAAAVARSASRPFSTALLADPTRPRTRTHAAPPLSRPAALARSYATESSHLGNLSPHPGSAHKVRFPRDPLLSTSLTLDYGPQRKRIGRGIGSGKGGRATRGQKGQKARAGNGKPKAHFEGGQTPLTMRYPKRGFTNP